jgi:hypothetical protein
MESGTYLLTPYIFNRNSAAVGGWEDPTKKKERTWRVGPMRLADCGQAQRESEIKEHHRLCETWIRLEWEEAVSVLLRKPAPILPSSSRQWFDSTSVHCRKVHECFYWERQWCFKGNCWIQGIAMDQLLSTGHLEVDIWLACLKFLLKKACDLQLT